VVKIEFNPRIQRWPCRRERMLEKFVGQMGGVMRNAPKMINNMHDWKKYGKV